jgi:circadian clock protein KaiC
MNDKVHIVQLDTGVPGLNEVLGGGLPEYSFNLLAGGPGAGKTTLVHQICFALATPARPALYITVLGEPPLKLLRYQQQFAFFDAAKVNRSIRFISIEHEILEQGLGQVLERIVKEVEATSPSLVVVDSFRSVIRASQIPEHNGELSLQAFVQRLALQLTTWQATTFLVGEYQNSEKEDNPIFTVADGTLWLNQSIERSSIVRKLQVVKMRGQAPVPGLQTFRITDKGVQVFPRLPIPKEVSAEDVKKIGTLSKHVDRVSTGVRGLDELMGGGIPAGSSLLVAGPSGSGKTILSMQFLAEGVTRQQPGLLAVFEKRPSDYLKTNPLGEGIARQIHAGSLHVIYLRPLDLSLDETLDEVPHGGTGAWCETRRDRLALGLGAGARPRVPRRLPRDAPPDGRHADLDGHYAAHDRGSGGLVHRSAVQPARDGLSDRWHHPAALYRARRAAQTIDGDRQTARQST